MTTILAFKQGISKARHTKRMIVFAWIANVCIALMLAYPLRNQLDSYIRGTAMEEKLVQAMDENWYRSYQFDFEKSEIARLLDYSVFGYAPFIHHLNSVLGGNVARNVGSFFIELFTSFRINPTYFNILILLSLLYSVVGSYIAGGFIGMYAQEGRSSFQDFLIYGARYFGRFFRLSLFSLVIYNLLFRLLFDWATNAIPLWTQNSPSEMTPFLYYMFKNAVLLTVIGLTIMCLDYARVRIVVEDRLSSFLALLAGARFAFANIRKSLGLYLLLMLISVAFIALYAIIERNTSQASYGALLLVVILQQAYMLTHCWVKALTYASETSLYQAVERGTTSAAARTTA